MISNIDGTEDATELLPLEHFKSEVYIHFAATNDISIVLLFSDNDIA